MGPLPYRVTQVLDAMARGASDEEHARTRAIRWRDPDAVADEMRRAEAALREEQARARQDRGQ
eukprot:307186-Lingulodinium_polyedra.AAC.1